MPITAIEEDHIELCCAACDHLRDVPMRELAGLNSDVRLAGALHTPSCPNCRSVELLIPSAAHGQSGPDDGSFGHLHQLLVDALDARLSGEDGRARSDEFARWLPEGLRMPSGIGREASIV